MINSEWLALMPSTASFQNVTSRDVYGKKTGGTTTTFKCHIKLNRREAYDSEGNIVTYGGTVIMDDVYNVDKNAILTLPDGTSPKILNVQTYYDENGPHHTTVDFEG